MIYGKEIKENLVKVNYEEENIKITGIIGNTLVARDTRKDQIIFLNKRNIKNITLTSSADQAFKGATGIGKYGFFILNIEMNANEYDVNVHPTKTEVRFKEEDKIARILYHAIKNAMLNTEFLGNKQIEENNSKYIENEYEFLTNKIQTNQFEKQEETNIELRKREEKRVINYKYIGILFRTYIIIEVEDEIYLIDQHAAHERVLYEQIKENYKKHIQQNSQLMLIPEVVTLTHQEMEFVRENKEMLVNIGFDIEEFGENTLKINGIPDLEYRAKTTNIFLDILDEMLTNQRTSIKDIEERFIATVACKAAVKANMDLTRQEVDKLIQNLLSLNNPYTCPHGRPTTIKISREDLKIC
jgi:DNA mismatch repair protein mutL